MKIEALARADHRAIAVFSTAAPLVERLRALEGDARPAVVLVDLEARDDQGFVLLEHLVDMREAPPTLAFYPHVDDMLRRRALGLGATKVVPRSAAMGRFPALVAEVSASPKET